MINHATHIEIDNEIILSRDCINAGDKIFWYLWQIATEIIAAVIDQNVMRAVPRELVS